MKLPKGFALIFGTGLLIMLLLSERRTYQEAQHLPKSGIPQSATRSTTVHPVYTPSTSITTWSMMHVNKVQKKPSTTTKPSTVMEDRKAEERFKRRHLRVRSICKQKSRISAPPIRWNFRGNFLVDVPHRLLVCAVPKSGSTSWHTLIWSVERKRLNVSRDPKLYTPNDTTNHINKALNLDRKEWQKLIASSSCDSDFKRDPPEGSSFRIILARHPFARFISGWNQKFLLELNFWVFLMKVHPRLIEYKEEIDPDRVFSFADFARFAAENRPAVRSTEAHFAPASQVCSPCQIDYTYVVKAESIDADDRWLMKRLGLSDIALGREGMPNGGSVVNSDLKGNIKTFMQKLSPRTIRQLYELYIDDFEIFGYTFNFRTLEAGGFD